MATYSTGVTATFNGTGISEIVGLSWNFGGGLSDARSVAWRAFPGSVTIELLGFATTAIYGARGSLVISGGGVNLTCTAVCTDVGVTAEVNGLARYTYSFDILDN